MYTIQSFSKIQFKNIQISPSSIPPSSHPHLNTHTITYIENIPCVYIYILLGGFNPSEKYESQWGLLFPIYEKMFQTCPNHQSV